MGSGSIADLAETVGARPEVADLRRLGRRMLRAGITAARKNVGPSLADVLAAHLGPDVAALPVVGTQWPTYEHVNVQLAIEHWLQEEGRSHELVGVSDFQHRSFTLGDLARGEEQFGPKLGSAAMIQLATGPSGEVHDCVRCGLYLATEPDRTAKVALLLRQGDPHGPQGPEVQLEVIANETAVADRVLKEIGALALEHNVFRGQIVSFEAEMFGPRSATLQFLARPSLERDALVLPDGVLDLIERQVVGVAQGKELLRAAGQHLKRGLLLHGPPGTGKTHTIRYLLGQLEGVTIVILSGAALSAIAEACSVARALQPSAVIVEDVDLIAGERDMPGPHSLLFQLLNEMDGLGDDVDVVFLLTTNRVDLLEPALATRPGRVDQAVEIPLPSADGRRALISLYRGKLRLEVPDLDPVLERTEGVTASFIKELLRRAALTAIAAGRSSGGEVTVTDVELTSALDELLDSRNGLTRRLLGGTGSERTPSRLVEHAPAGLLEDVPEGLLEDPSIGWTEDPPGST